MRVFIYVAQKATGPLLLEVWKMVKSQGKSGNFVIKLSGNPVTVTVIE